MTAIRGKVAEIINWRELVLNVGSDGGVKTGMRFAVMSAKGATIVDPDTGENLGAVEIPKVLVDVTRVQDRLSVARTFRTHQVNRGGSGLSTLGIFQPPRWVEEAETLRLEDKPNLEELTEDESYVKIGDPVVQILGDEYTIE